MAKIFKYFEENNEYTNNKSNCFNSNIIGNIYYVKSNKDYNETLRILPKSIRVSHTTFKKYIIIGNQLDYCLQEKAA